VDLEVKIVRHNFANEFEAYLFANVAEDMGGQVFSIQHVSEFQPKKWWQFWVQPSKTESSGWRVWLRLNGLQKRDIMVMFEKHIKEMVDRKSVMM